MKRPLFALTSTFLGALLFSSAVFAGAIFPVDRAAILVGSRFDFKVEFDDISDPNTVKVTINGVDHAEALGKSATFHALTIRRRESGLRFISSTNH